LAGAGARTGVLTVDDGVARQLGKVNMLPNSDADGNAAPFGVLNWLLLATAVGLMAALIYLTIDRQRQVLALLDTRAGTARQAAQAVPILRKKATALAAEAVFLQERKATSISTVGLLEELSALLPDHTWLTLLELKGGEIRLNGFSQSSSEILGLIEASPHFRNARFLAPVTRDARRNAEKFSLTANLSQSDDGGG
jgi:general secretion pathway protein L